jgi:hypothetical protein
MQLIESIMMESMTQELMAANGQRRPPQAQQPPLPQQQQQPQPRQKKEKPLDPSFGNVAQQLF